MFNILALVRNWLERELFHSIRTNLTGDFFMVESDPKILTLKRMVVEVGQKRFLGLIPIFKIRKTGSISLVNLIKAPLLAAQAVFSDELSLVPARISNLVKTELDDSIKNRIDLITTETNLETARLTEVFKEKDFLTFVRTDRNIFRQRLLEELGKQEAQIFREITRKRLVELVMRIRQENADNNLSSVLSDRTESLVALPTGTRFFIKKSKMTIFVVEQAPRTRTMKIMESDGERSGMYQLSFPYVVFFVVLRGRKSESMYVFFRKKPLMSTNDGLLCPALPNIYENFQVCFSPSASKDSLAITVEESINSFWGGRFIRSHDPSNLTHQISIEDWENGTKKESFFALSRDWRDARTTVAKMIDEISSKFTPGSSEKSVGGSNNILTNLEKIIDGISTSIANEMKETCFNLVPDWIPDEAVLDQVVSRFSEIVADLGEFVRIKLGEEVEGVLSEETLRRILEAAVRQTLKSFDESIAEKPIASAHQAFLAQLKERLD